MKKKIVFFCIGVLLLFSLTPIIQAMVDNGDYESINTPRKGGYVLFGFIQRLYPDEYTGEFEVVSFLVLRGNGEKVEFDKGDKIQFEGPIFCIIFNYFICGFTGGYSIIE